MFLRDFLSIPNYAPFHDFFTSLISTVRVLQFSINFHLIVNVQLLMSFRQMESDSDDNLIDEDDMRVPNQFSFLNLRPNQVTNRKKETRTKYRDYHSIDWLRELSRDRQRHHLIENDRKSGRLDLRLVFLIFDFI